MTETSRGVLILIVRRHHVDQTEELAWLVEHRHKIHAFLLDLWKVLPDKSVKGSRPVNVLQLLVGAGFSLWRAAFLANERRSWEYNAQHAKDFLLKVIKDNAITYTQEQQTSEWAVGYYLNSAYLRLKMGYDALEFKTALSEQVTAFIERQITAEEYPPNLREPWVVAYEASRELFGEAASSKRLKLTSMEAKEGLHS